VGIKVSPCSDYSEPPGLLQHENASAVLVCDRTGRIRSVAGQAINVTATAPSVSTEIQLAGGGGGGGSPGPAEGSMARRDASQKFGCSIPTPVGEKFFLQGLDRRN